MWWRGLVWPNRAEQVNDRECAAGTACRQTCQVVEDDDYNNVVDDDDFDDDDSDDDDDDLKLGGRLARSSNIKITIKDWIWPTLNHINFWSKILLANDMVAGDVIKDQDQKFDLIKVKSDQSCSLVIVL